MVVCAVLGRPVVVVATTGVPPEVTCGGLSDEGVLACPGSMVCGGTEDRSLLAEEYE